MKFYAPFRSMHKVCIQKILLVMKITFFFILIAALHVSASSFAQKINLKVSHAPLKEVFEEITKQSGYSFLFSDRQLKETHPVSLDLRDIPIQEALGKILADQHLTYTISLNTIVIKPAKSIQAELPVAVSISGRVTDEKGQPLPGVSVAEKGTTNGIITGVSGAYTLKVAGPNSTLVFSFTGFETQEIKVGTQTSIDIKLIEKISDLNEIVVVGYGTSKKASLTGAISTIKGSDIVSTRNESILNSLSGKLPGVRVVQNTSEPGSFNNSFDIRGLGSPLIVIDGVQRSMSTFSRLDPNDIDNISVLKDASAAVYGVQAANGVVLITTKKGKAGTSELTYSVNGGIQWPGGLPNVLGATDWMTILNEKSMHNIGSPTITYPQSQFDLYNSGQLKSADWYGATLNKTAPQWEHNLTATGGSDKATYYVSFGYSNQDGFYKSGSLNYDKYNIRSDVNAKITKRLTVDLNLSGIIDTKNQPVQDAWQIYANLFRNAPIASIYANDNPAYLNNISGGVANYGSSSVAISNSDISGYKKLENTLFNGGLTLTYDVPYIEGLTAKGFYSYDYTINDNKVYQQTYNVYLANVNTTVTPNTVTYVPSQAQVPAYVNRSYNKGINTLLQFSLDYNHTFAKYHNVQALALYEETGTNSDNFSAQRNVTLPVDQLGAGTALNQVANQNLGGIQGYATRSYVGKLHYDFKSKYLADFSVRDDGSSRFAANKRFGLFPAVLAAYRLSEEPFIKKSSALSFIDNLKFRGSYGVTGDASGLNYQYLSGYTYPGPVTGGTGGLPNGTVFDGAYINGVGFGLLPNPNITWFTAKSLNIGVDADFWRGLFGFTFEYFNRNRDGLLATQILSLPGSVGANLPQVNINSDQSRGYELSLTHNNKIGAVNYHIGANVSYTRTKWRHYESAPQGNSYADWRNGQNNRYNDVWFGLGSNGRFQSFGEIQGAPINYGSGNRSTVPGDFKYQDWNNDGVIDAMDWHPIASTYNTANSNGTPNSAPPLVNFGFSIGGSYKNFDFDALIQGAAEKWIAYQQDYIQPSPQGGQALAQFLNRWHPVDPTANPFNPNTQYVSGYYPYSGTVPDANSAYNVNNASYARLKSITIGYTFPSNLTKKIGLKRFRMYVSGYNLVTVTGIRNVDPEHTQDLYGEQYPLNKTINFGLNATF
jgi:TonB-linked SusC/RagA family outer membrane protein